MKESIQYIDQIDDFPSYGISSDNLELTIRFCKKTRSKDYLRHIYHAFLDMEVDRQIIGISPGKDLIDDCIKKIYGAVEGQKLIDEFISNW